MGNISFDTSGTIVTLIIAAIFGYFVYDKSIEAAVAVAGITFVVGLVTLLSLIPVAGWIASALLSYFVVIPGMLTMTGIEHTWLITWIFVANVLIGLLITALMSVAAIKILTRRQNVR